jgi:hypothetical protein
MFIAIPKKGKLIDSTFGILNPVVEKGIKGEVRGNIS